MLTLDTATEMGAKAAGGTMPAAKIGQGRKASAESQSSLRETAVDTVDGPLQDMSNELLLKVSWLLRVVALDELQIRRERIVEPYSRTKLGA